MPRLVRTTLSILGYLGYFAGHLFFALLVIPLYLLLSLHRKAAARFIGAAFQLWVVFLTRCYLPLLGVYRIVELSGRPPQGFPAPAIFVANHRSRIDGPLLLGLTRPAGTLMKAAYARSPLYAGFVKYLDFVSVDTSSLQSLAATVAEAQTVTRKGHNLVVFPEGTRSPSGRLLPFKESAFRIARSMDLPVIPVVLHTDYPFMARCAASIFPPRTLAMTVRFCEPTRIAEDERPAECAARIERLIASHLRELDKGTVWSL